MHVPIPFQCDTNCEFCSFENRVQELYLRLKNYEFLGRRLLEPACILSIQQFHGDLRRINRENATFIQVQNSPSALRKLIRVASWLLYYDLRSRIVQYVTGWSPTFVTSEMDAYYRLMRSIGAIITGDYPSPRVEVEFEAKQGETVTTEMTTTTIRNDEADGEGPQNVSIRTMTVIYIAKPILFS